MTTLPRSWPAELVLFTLARGFTVDEARNGILMLLALTVLVIMEAHKFLRWLAACRVS